jgi:spermidine synthase
MNLRRGVFLLFLVSGFCGLLYQVIWVRLAMMHFGVITPVLSVVVSVFMLGLAVGSWAAGRWVGPLTKKLKRSAIGLYAATEFLIGVGAFAVPRLFKLGETLLLPGGGMDSVAYLSSSALIITLTLLPWCFLMGATYPLMAAFLKERTKNDPASFSHLYLANVIGAVLGTILTAGVFVELWGFRQTLTLAGFCNFLIAAGALALGKTYSSPQPCPEKGEGADVSLSHLGRGSKGGGFLPLILFTTGLGSMALEVVWTRAFTPILNTTIYAFALILAVYLTATAFGSWLYRRHLAAGRSFSTAGLLAALAASAFLPILFNDPRIPLGRLQLLRFGVEAGIFPLCACLGYLTPKLIDAYSLGDPDKVGRAYAINVLGCIIGPVFASYAMLPAFGVKLSMVVLAVPFIGFMLLFVRELKSWKMPALAAIGSLFLCALVVNISYEEKYPGGVVRRDATATVISAGEGFDKNLFVNGQGITMLTTITKEMAHLPLAALHHPPAAALDICFGMGTTYRALLTWGIPVTAAELVPSVRDAFPYYFADAAALMENTFGKIVIDDGRRFLKRTNQVFDVVTIDPPPPVEAAASSLLYSVEFYDALKKHLAPGGILQQWFPGEDSPECRAVARSLAESFPHIRVFKSITGEGYHFLCSLDPIELPSAAKLASRLPKPARADLVEWCRLERRPPREARYRDAAAVFQRILSQEVSIAALIEPANGPKITDDRPYNEYYLLRRHRLIR